jgi:biotin synthase
MNAPSNIPETRLQEDIRQDWTLEAVGNLFALPMNDVLFQAHTLHRKFFDPNSVQLSTLLNIKTGGCAEDCSYCSQSAKYETDVEPEPLMELPEVIEAAKKAKARGASRFCMGAAWRQPKERHFIRILEMVEAVKDLGLETCMTLGMLSQDQASRLKQTGLDYYNHNLDTSREYYEKIITTRTYDDRLETLKHVREAGIRVCCGGIIGLGEGQDDRSNLLIQLANMEVQPESVPINVLIRSQGTPLQDTTPPDPFDIVRTVAVARIMMPATCIRLSAGRSEMSDEQQALCFFAGANSIFYGEKLLTADNPDFCRDQHLFSRLGLHESA